MWWPMWWQEWPRTPNVESNRITNKSADTKVNVTLEYMARVGFGSGIGNMQLFQCKTAILSTGQCSVALSI